MRAASGGDCSPLCPQTSVHGPVFCRPQRLAPRRRFHARCRTAGEARIVRRDDVDRIADRGRAIHCIDDAPVVDEIVGDDAGARITGSVEPGAQDGRKARIDPALVPQADGIERQAMPRRAAHERNQIVGAFRRTWFPHPRRPVPRQRAEADRGVAPLRLGHQPPFITTVAVDRVRGAHMRRLRALGRIAVGADFDLQLLQRRAEARSEQIIEDRGPLCGRIVDKQPCRRAAAAGRTDAVEPPAVCVPVKDDVARCRHRRATEQQRGEGSGNLPHQP